MVHQNKQFRLSLSVFLDAVVLVVVFSFAAGIVTAQTCIPPTWQGNTNSCQGINGKFLNRNSINDIDHFVAVWNTDGVSQVLPGNALGVSRTGLSCNWSSTITLTQYLKNGASCVTNSTGSAPHTFPCSLCGNAAAPLTILNALNYRSSSTSDSIAVAFGEGLTTVTAAAIAKPLPLNLGGVQVWVDDVQAGLFFVSPLQVNFYVPSGLSVGLKNVRITNTEGKTFTGQIYLAVQAPGVATKDGTGAGDAAADYGNGYVALFATGINYNLLTKADITLHTSAGDYPCQYVGPTGNALIGLVQINVLNVPILGQGAELHVGGFVSQGFILRR